MDDDLKCHRALEAYIRIVGIVEEHGKSLSTESAGLLLETMKELSSILGLLETDSVPRREFLELVNVLTSLRDELRAKREYALSDQRGDRKSTRLNSSHPSISYAVFCLKKKK